MLHSVAPPGVPACGRKITQSNCSSSTSKTLFWLPKHLSLLFLCLLLPYLLAIYIREIIHASQPIWTLFTHRVTFGGWVISGVIEYH